VLFIQVVIKEIDTIEMQIATDLIAMALIFFFSLLHWFVSNNNKAFHKDDIVNLSLSYCYMVLWLSKYMNHDVCYISLE